MKKTSASKLAEIVGFCGDLVDVEVERVETDSRKIQKGDLFIAIRGEKFDGHNFVKQVLESGAELVIVEHLVEGVDIKRQIVVENSLKAYGKIGAYNRSLFEGKVIGLTGSAGKTTTKEEIKFALEQFGKVYATKGNFNNNVGVPITLCDIDFDADYAVIEMGMKRLLWMGCTYFLCVIMEVGLGMLRGMGNSLLPTISTFVGTCVLRVGWVLFIFPLKPCLESLYMSFMISWILTGIFTYICCARVFKKSKRQYQRQLALESQ